MADDLEAFLRQAARKRAERKTPPRVQPPSSSPRASRPEWPPSQQPSGRAPTGEDDVVEAEVVPATPHQLAADLSTSEHGRYTPYTGETKKDEGTGPSSKVDLGRDEFQARVQQAFDHHVGALDDQPGMPAIPPGTKDEEGSAGREIARLLANPKSLRTAIILNEILTPRHFR